MSMRVWPVIHVQSQAQVLANAAIAAAAGVHGVFLIHMDGEDDTLDPLGAVLRARYPELKIGVNYLSLPAPAALEHSLASGFDATWTDKPGVRSDGEAWHVPALAARLAAHPKHLFFGSVAFKYQPEDPEPGAAAVKAWARGMIPTTSGLATGQAPSLEKLVAIRAALGPNAPLALASGVDPNNVALLAPLLTDILVSTGISRDFYNFNPERLAQLLARVAD